ncbi:hypothetical protein NQZ68_005033 [Dissostichus eleginoides]|nr:hypothetical protein NQZ68_005033 [Dissostichus eleginoides]
MAKVQTPTNNSGKSAFKKKNNGRHSKKAKSNYCTLCRIIHLKDEAQDHVHGMLHHRELETVLGKNSFHECQACNASSMGLNEYAQHISTPQHKAKLHSLQYNKIKPLPLFKTLSNEAMNLILERNKTLKKEEKKAVRRRKKKNKQVYDQKRAEVQGKNTAVSKAVLMKNKQVNNWKLQQGTFQQGRTLAVVQNKENKLSSVKRLLHQGESSLPNQSGRLSCLSGEPGHTQHVPVHKCAQSAQQCSQRDLQNDYYNKPYDGDFTSDHFPHNGAIIFGLCQGESSGCSHSGKEASAQHSLANESANAAPIRDVDVSAMLRQIRRALGVREPCRADREARKQSSETGGQTKAGRQQQARCSFRNKAKETPIHVASAAATSMQSSYVNSPASSSTAGAGPSNIAPMWENVSNGPTLARKFRIARDSAIVQGGKMPVPKPTINKVFSLSVPKGKSNWREMYEDRKRMKQERGKVRPRFGIELTKRHSEKESSTRAEGIDMSLSEGFHWEAFSDTLSGAHWDELPPPPQNATYYESYTEPQSDPQRQEPSEQPDAAQEGCSTYTVQAVRVKVESDVEFVDLSDHSDTSKRKHNMCDGLADKESSGKKKKTKSNNEQGQMDQLLAVSLREDELSHSLQNWDVSLIQARNTLQAAYAEVQRLLLLRQQVPH